MMAGLPKNRTAWLLVVALLASLLAACSFKTVYNRLDVLIPEYVEGLVTIDDALENNLRQRSTELLEWHRHTQLVQYADWLRAFQGEVGKLTIDSARYYAMEAERFWDAMSARIDREMAELLPLLDASQQKELFASITEKNEDFADEYIDIDDAERRTNYYERTRDTYESWVGDLSEAQEQTIRQATDRLLDGARLRLDRREEWQAGIQVILAGPGSREQKSQLLHDYLQNFEFSKAQSLDSKIAVNKDIIAELTVAISNSMNEEQAGHFVDKTNDYIRMFTELSENR
jgi:hypothetical protein